MKYRSQVHFGRKEQHCLCFDNRFWEGFTLAEVLITLGIIGVVAALTLPSLIAKYKEQEAVSRLKKAQSTLANAYMLARSEHSDVSTWFTTNDIKTNSEIFFNNLKPYLNVAKDCGFKNGCITPGYVKTLDGRNYVMYDNAATEYKFGLVDGSSFVIFISNPNCSKKNDFCGNIKVDIDGLRGAYTMGKDFFIFQITPEVIVPEGIDMSDFPYSFDTYCNKSKTSAANGRACAAWVLQNGNMDYLKCDDLDWNTKTKCK